MAVRKEGRHRIREKLKEIECHKNFIIKYVEDISIKAKSEATGLLQIKDKRTFMDQLMPVMHNVESMVTKLFKLKAFIADDEDHSSSISSSDSECGDDIKPCEDKANKQLSTISNVCQHECQTDLSDVTAVEQQIDIQKAIEVRSAEVEVVICNTEKKVKLHSSESKPCDHANKQTDVASNENSYNTTFTEVQNTDGIDITPLKEINLNPQCSSSPKYNANSQKSSFEIEATLFKNNLRKIIKDEHINLSEKDVPKQCCSIDQSDISANTLVEMQNDAEISVTKYMPPAPEVSDCKMVGENVSKSLLGNDTGNKLCSHNVDDNDLSLKTNTVRCEVTAKDESVAASNIEPKGSELPTTSVSKEVAASVSEASLNASCKLSPNKTIPKIKRGKGAPKVLKSSRTKSECSSIASKQVKVSSNSGESDIAFNVQEYLENYDLGPELPKYKLKENESMEVLVSEVINPSLFWIQPLDFSSQLEDLMSRINLRNSNMTAKDPFYKLKKQPKGGMAVLACYTNDNNWYRARVISVWHIKIEPLNLHNRGHLIIEVLYVDYGNREKVGMDRIRPMPQEFATLPAQSFACALSGVAPLGNGWTSTQSQDFAQFMLKNEHVYASCHPHNNSPITYVDLLVPQQNPLPTVSVSGAHGPTASVSMMVNIGEVFVYKLRQAITESNDVINEQFFAWAQLHTPNTADPQLKHALRETSLHNYNAPHFIDDSPAPFISDADSLLSGRKEPVVKTKQSNYDQMKTRKSPLENIDIPKKACRAPATKKKEKNEDVRIKTPHIDIKAADRFVRNALGVQVQDKKIDDQTSKMKQWEKELKSDWKGLYSISAEKSKYAQKFFDDISKYGKLVTHSFTEKFVFLRYSKKEEALNVMKNLSHKYVFSVPQVVKEPPYKTVERKVNSDLKRSSSRKDTIHSNGGEDDELMDETFDECLDQELAKSICSQYDLATSQNIQHQKLKDLGLPSRLPKECQYANTYNQLMAGEPAPQLLNVTDPTVSDNFFCSNEGDITPALADLPGHSMKFKSFEMTVPEDGYVLFLMAYIQNPEKFWVHLVNQSSAETVDSLMKDLNKYYNASTTNKMMLKKYFHKTEPKVGDIVCSQFREDDRFYRSEIIGIERCVGDSISDCGSSGEINRIRVFYVDFGNEEWVPLNRIYPLPPSFVDIAPQAVCCGLAGVKPLAEGGGDTVSSWKLPITREFVNSTGFDKVLLGYVCGKELGTKIKPSRREPLQLIVVDTNKDLDVWINEEMQRKGLGVFTPPPEYDIIMSLQVNSQDDHLDSEKAEAVGEEIKGWDPMTEDFLSQRNSYMVDTDDPGVATVGYRKSRECLEDALNKTRSRSYVDFWLDHLMQVSSCKEKEHLKQQNVLPHSETIVNCYSMAEQEKHRKATILLQTATDKIYTTTFKRVYNRGVQVKTCSNKGIKRSSIKKNKAQETSVLVDDVKLCRYDGSSLQNNNSVCVKMEKRKVDILVNIAVEDDANDINKVSTERKILKTENEPTGSLLECVPQKSLVTNKEGMEQKISFISYVLLKENSLPKKDLLQGKSLIMNSVMEITSSYPYNMSNGIKAKRNLCSKKLAKEEKVDKEFKTIEEDNVTGENIMTQDWEGINNKIKVTNTWHSGNSDKRLTNNLYSVKRKRNASGSVISKTKITQGQTNENNKTKVKENLSYVKSGTGLKEGQLTVNIKKEITKDRATKNRKKNLLDTSIVNSKAKDLCSIKSEIMVSKDEATSKCKTKIKEVVYSMNNESKLARLINNMEMPEKPNCTDITMKIKDQNMLNGNVHQPKYGDNVENTTELKEESQSVNRPMKVTKQQNSNTKLNSFLNQKTKVTNMTSKAQIPEFNSYTRKEKITVLNNVNGKIKVADNSSDESTILKDTKCLFNAIKIPEKWNCINRKTKVTENLDNVLSEMKIKEDRDIIIRQVEAAGSVQVTNHLDRRNYNIKKPTVKNSVKNELKDTKKESIVNIAKEQDILLLKASNLDTTLDKWNVDTKIKVTRENNIDSKVNIFETNHLVNDKEEYGSNQINNGKGQDETRVCYHYGTKRGCSRGDACPYEHLDYKEGITVDKRLVYCTHDSENGLRPPERGSWVPVEITAIFNPGHFYVSFPFGVRHIKDVIREEKGDEGYGGSQTNITESLEALGEAMNETYDRMMFRDTDLIVAAPGEIIAAQYSIDQQWYRARVIQPEPELEKLKVFFVDFGNSEWINESNTRQMQPQFMHLPFQAMECFLPIDPANEGAKWSQESKQLFRKLVDGKLLFAHVLSRGYNILCVDLYDSENQPELNIAKVLIEHKYAVRADDTVSTRSCTGSMTSKSISSSTSIHNVPSMFPG